MIDNNTLKYSPSNDDNKKDNSQDDNQQQIESGSSQETKIDNDEKVIIDKKQDHEKQDLVEYDDEMEHDEVKDQPEYSSMMDKGKGKRTYNSDSDYGSDYSSDSEIDYQNKQIIKGTKGVYDPEDVVMEDIYEQKNKPDKGKGKRTHDSDSDDEIKDVYEKNKINTNEPTEHKKYDDPSHSYHGSAESENYEDKSKTDKNENENVFIVRRPEVIEDEIKELNKDLNLINKAKNSENNSDVDALGDSIAKLSMKGYKDFFDEENNTIKEGLKKAEELTKESLAETEKERLDCKETMNAEGSQIKVWNDSELFVKTTKEFYDKKFNSEESPTSSPKTVIYISSDSEQSPTSSPKTVIYISSDDEEKRSFTDLPLDNSNSSSSQNNKSEIETKGTSTANTPAGPLPNAETSSEPSTQITNDTSQDNDTSNDNQKQDSGSTIEDIFNDFF